MWTQSLAVVSPYHSYWREKAKSYQGRKSEMPCSVAEVNSMSIRSTGAPQRDLGLILQYRRSIALNSKRENENTRKYLLV